MHMLCHILVKCRDLRGLSHLAEMLRFTRFVAFGRNVAIYAFCQAQNVCSQASKTILNPCHDHEGASDASFKSGHNLWHTAPSIHQVLRQMGGSGCGLLVVVAVTNCTSLPEAPCSLCGSVTLRAALTHSSLLNITFTLILIPPPLTGG